MLESISISLTALYLRGLDRPVTPHRRRWARVASCLRLADTSLGSFASVLHDRGFYEEALILSSEVLLQKSHCLINEQRVLTAVDTLYPNRWIETLREAAPPALWLAGDMPTHPLLGIVGSRNIDTNAREFTEKVARRAVELGYSIVSGGANGADLAAAKGALLAEGQVLEVLPYGIDRYIGIGKVGISPSAPTEEFSTSLAMERNSLIYSAADYVVVIDPRFKVGGTWNGAFEAIRKQKCRLIVRDIDSPASKALISLGAIPISQVDQLASIVSMKSVQRGLFTLG